MVANLNIQSLIGIKAQSEFDLAEIVEKGIPTDSILHLRDNGLTFSEVASIVISPRTLKHRKARGEQLSNDETERVIRVARILSLSEQVFASHDKALLWLRTSRRPIEEPHSTEHAAHRSRRTTGGEHAVAN